ncbi:MULTISPECIES: hypothetical protein [unclassified Haematobacter]|uniref:hypothetical protein n=1 Tax=unclassified Haematobacter TaxID=2640585 RepID=UPI0025C42F28|nr:MULTISPECIES: hypothetical protein [unclassified Haematobacter]
MTQMDFWQNASELPVTVAAILIAGGDPAAIDWEDDGLGRSYPVMRTVGHPGFQAVFTTLTAAIRNGDVSARFVYRAADDGPLSPRMEGEVWLLSQSEIHTLKAAFDHFDDDPFAETPLQNAHRIQVAMEPDWTQTTVTPESLQAWPPARIWAKDFFTRIFDPDDFMDVSHPHFCAELAFAAMAWRGVAKNPVTRITPKAAVEAWIGNNKALWPGKDPMGTVAAERIATLVNWKKGGGAPRTS